MTVNAVITGGAPWGYLSSTPPTASDSNYLVGTFWHLLDGSIYVLADNTSGAAVWKQIAPGPLAKAWINFVGSSGAISASYNVSSVTRNGTGNYTIAFTNALLDTNYAVTITTTGTGSLNWLNTLHTGSVSILTNTITAGALGSINAVDPSVVTVVVFGNL